MVARPCIHRTIARVRSVSRSFLLLLLPLLMTAAVVVAPAPAASAQSLRSLGSSPSPPASPQASSPPAGAAGSDAAPAGLDAAPAAPNAPSAATGTAPVTTAPVTTVPATTAPVTTSPVTTSPATTVPVTTAPAAVAGVGGAAISAAPDTAAVTASETTAASRGADAAGGSDPSTSFTLSEGVKDFLSGLSISVGDGTLTGTLDGSVLTVKVGAPAIPVSLPIGGQTVSFGGATLTVDESTGILSLSASGSASGGVGATLSVTIANASTTTLDDSTKPDLAATVDVTGVSLFGTTVALSGTLGYSGGKPVASLTGTLTSDAVVASGVVTVLSGATVTLSTEHGLTLSGSAALGAADSVFTVAVTGAVSDVRNWSLTVDDTTNTPSFTPIAGLTISRPSPA